MKKNSRIWASVLIAAFLLMTACGKKTYATAEEWYTSNPLASTFVNAALASEADNDMEMHFSISGNTIIYGLEMDEVVFGQNEELDEIYRESFDTAFADKNANYAEIITNLSSACGIASEELSLRIEIFNPKATVPDYTYTYN